MPDLSQPQIDAWLNVHGSQAILAETGSGLDGHPLVLPSVLKLGVALDDAANEDEVAARRLLSGPDGTGRLAAILAGIGGGRRLRLVHWLHEALPDGSPPVLDQLLGQEVTGPGATLRRWILHLQSRELLGSLFAQARIEALVEACNAVETQEHAP